MKGTARYMSMAGAFGALGGDLSVLSHNPGGIGVYRNSEVGITADLDIQHAESNSNGMKLGINQTKFLLNNVGFVWTFRLPSATIPNVNVGFTYNKSVSFNRRYRGSINLNNSLSNYIASVTTEGGYVEGQLYGDQYNDFNPYNPPDPGDAAPWLSILGYQSGLIFGQNINNGSVQMPFYSGEWGSETKGTGYFDVQESGGVDSYNVALGGNISNVVFWGMDFDITHLNYNINPVWSEDLTNARVIDEEGYPVLMSDAWKLSNMYNCNGTGFNFKLGVIVKPIQELRLGLAFETPTWYNLTQTFGASIQNRDFPDLDSETNDGMAGYNDFNFRTPWKVNASAAAVLFNRLILSAEYEWAQYSGMKFSTPSPWGYGGDYWYPDDYYPGWDWFGAGTRATDFDPFISNDQDDFYATNRSISTTYSNTNTVRIGAEFRVLDQLSVRAGYSFVSSPTKTVDQNAPVAIGGTMPNYRYDNTTNYITCGLGYRIKSFYVDLAYVYKNMTSTYHAYSPFYPDPQRPYYPEQGKPYILEPIQSPTSSLSLSNSQIVLSAGFKF